jgi:hypothetical protein
MELLLGHRVRPKSPKMYMIKCCGAKSSCRNMSPKKKPPDWVYPQINQVKQLLNFLKEEHQVKSNQVRTTIEIKISDCGARIAKITCIVVKT